MQQIEWIDENAVGVPSIDAQHKELVALTNSLFLAIMHDKGEATLMDILLALADYATTHFAHEESLLQQYGFPREQFLAHVEEHQDLTRRVHEYIQEAEKCPEALDIQVFAFLREWMSGHLSCTDSQYSSFLKAMGAR